MPIIEPPSIVIVPDEFPEGVPFTTVIVPKLAYNPDSDEVEEQGTETLYIRTAVEQRCHNCRFWSLEYGKGKCSSKKFKLGYHEDLLDLLPDEVQVEDDEGWGFCPGPRFGCIHWKVKDGKD